MNNEKICVNCQFWFEYDIHSRLSTYKQGECRRYAPYRMTQWGVVEPMGPASSEIHPALHPATDKTHWCGEFKFQGTE